jgi:hypothetical protein
MWQPLWPVLPQWLVGLVDSFWLQQSVVVVEVSLAEQSRASEKQQFG